jgi:hypothetical protein
MPFLHHKRRDKASKDALTDQSCADDCNPQSHSERLSRPQKIRKRSTSQTES